MTFTPGRTSKKDIFTGEVELDGSSIQRNFDLVSRETNKLNDRITSNEVDTIKTTQRLKQQTSFVNAFLFGN